MCANDGEVASVGPGTATAATGAATAWVRRCAGCHRDDLRSAFGRAAVPEDSTWCCAVCGSSRWRPQPLAWPGPEGIDRCPFLAGRIDRT